MKVSLHPLERYVSPARMASGYGVRIRLQRCETLSSRLRFCLIVLGRPIRIRAIRNAASFRL